MAQNPLFNEKAFERAQAAQQRGFRTSQDEFTQEPMHLVRGEDTADNAMTLQGTINKTFFLLFLCVAGGVISWSHPQHWVPFLWLIALGALGIAIWTGFKPIVARFTAPIYAVLEGLLLGAISALYNAQFEGIVFNAVAITFLVFAIMLMLYCFKIVRVTSGLIKAVASATLAIAVLYMGSWILSLFGVNPSYLTSSSPLSIGISIVVCIVAAANFLLDFEFINQMTSTYAVPKYMEWYAGFSLLVTLIWLYLEILRLLGKTRRR